jgi:hypothetical protein
MWSFVYKSQTGIFAFQEKELGFSFMLHFEDGMTSEVIADNPVAFFHSRKEDETKQVKTVITVNIQTYELDISIHSHGKYDKMNYSLSPDVAKSLFQVAKVYQHLKSVPDFSFRPMKISSGVNVHQSD